LQDKKEKSGAGKKKKGKEDKQEPWDFELLNPIRILRKQDYVDFFKGQDSLSFGSES
jgi:hypothetical protein